MGVMTAQHRKAVSDMTTPDLYTYLDYRQFLRDWFQQKKQDNPRYSHRLFARRAGQRSPSMLLFVMEGKRNLTPKTAAAFAQAMGFDDADQAACGPRADLEAHSRPEKNFGPTGLKKSSGRPPASLIIIKSHKLYVRNVTLAA